MSHQAHNPRGASPDEGNLADYARRPRIGFVRELLEFLLHNKKWWLAPIILVLLIVALLIVLGGTGLAPFIYPL